MSIDARRAVVVRNPNSGISRDGKPQDEIRAALDAIGITSEFILLQRGLDLKKLIEERTKLGCDVVVAAGGDGTVSTVGALLAGTDVTLGVLPTGTLNHFAKDLGIPLDLNAATEVIARGATTLVDVGEVNGHIFLNNSSIGLYTTIVSERERFMQRGLSKPLAAIAAGMIALW